MRNEPEAFGTDLYQVLAEDAGDLVFSPSSVAGALRMAWYGARGQTAAELARALHLEPDAGPGKAPDHPHTRGSAVFRAPNTAWIQSGFAVRPEFTARLGDLAGAVLASADFAAAPEQTRTEINQAIAGQAEGKITGHGTEAAAATAVAVSARARVQAPPPVTMAVDRPFLFAILDSATGVTVFLGQVSQPRSS